MNGKYDDNNTAFTAKFTFFRLKTAVHNNIMKKASQGKESKKAPSLILPNALFARQIEIFN